MIKELVVQSKSVSSRRWFLDLLEDCREDIKIKSDEARSLVNEAHFNVGRKILDHAHQYEKENISETEFTRLVADALDKPPRTFLYCVQFARGNKTFAAACSAWKVPPNLTLGSLWRVLDGIPMNKQILDADKQHCICPACNGKHKKRIKVDEKTKV